ncbi:hypothetical protein [Streptomyces roseoverticillatus]|uniref:hypothetical protein n=1 Tax=Streptomyces roseoverticillatus TaxID=66429 RepID=UPI0004BEACCD|nr:hypothetical protein [Streptomyces roseoverticillatus]
MRTTAVTVAAFSLAAALSLTACSDESKAETVKSDGSSPSAAPAGPSAEPLALGKGTETVGAGGGGKLDITPVSVVYAAKTATDKPSHGLYAVVAVQERPMTDVAAAETTPTEKGGWQWIAADGQAVSAEPNVFVPGLDAGGPIRAGATQLRARTFDIAAAQRGGTLTYTDGEGKTFRWQIPAQDSGPQAAKVKKALGS